MNANMCHMLVTQKIKCFTIIYIFNLFFKFDHKLITQNLKKYFYF
jgi:hypothetical protein